MIVVKVYFQYHAREKDSTNDTEGRRTQHNFSHIYDHPQIVIPSVSSFDSYQIVPLVATVTLQTGSIRRFCCTCSISTFLQLLLLLVVSVAPYHPSYPLVPSSRLLRDSSVTSRDSLVTVSPMLRDKGPIGWCRNSQPTLCGTVQSALTLLVCHSPMPLLTLHLFHLHLSLSLSLSPHSFSSWHDPTVGGSH